MPSLGAINFITLRGVADATQKRVERVTPPGVDGESFLLLGKGSRPFMVEGVRDYLDQAAMTAGIATIKLLVGTLVTYTDDRAVVHTNCMVLDAEPVAEQQIITPVGGLVANATRLLTIRVLLQETNA